MVKLQNLKAINGEINSIFGNIYCLFFVNTLTYYACTPAYLHRTTDIVTARYWYKLVYFGMHSMIWICTSEYHRTVLVNLRRWISTKKLSSDLSIMDIGKLNILSMEIEHDPVGISCRYFTVNYQLISSVSKIGLSRLCHNIEVEVLTLTSPLIFPNS